MEITARHHGDILVLDMAGRLDTSTSGSAHDAVVDFAKTQPKKVVLNLDKLDVREQRRAARHPDAGEASSVIQR